MLQFKWNCLETMSTVRRNHHHNINVSKMWNSRNGTITRWRTYSQAIGWVLNQPIYKVLISFEAATKDGGFNGKIIFLILHKHIHLIMCRLRVRVGIVFVNYAANHRETRTDWASKLTMMPYAARRFPARGCLNKKQTSWGSLARKDRAIIRPNL